MTRPSYSSVSCMVRYIHTWKEISVVGTENSNRSSFNLRYYLELDQTTTIYLVLFGVNF